MRWFLLLLLLGQTPAEFTLVDRVVALVNEDPIFYSDLERIIGLGLVAPDPDEPREKLERRVLDGLIEQRLRWQEVQRYEIGALPQAEVEKQLSVIRDRFPDQVAFEQHLQSLSLGEADLRRLLIQQLQVITYVEARLGPRVFVDSEEVRNYYDQVLIPALKKRGGPLPNYEEVREDVRSLLQEVKLNEEIQSWTEDLRRSAQVVDLFVRSTTEELPPVVLRKD